MTSLREGKDTEEKEIDEEIHLSCQLGIIPSQNTATHPFITVFTVLRVQ
jgi:hypothetical protein